VSELSADRRSETEGPLSARLDVVGGREEPPGLTLLLQVTNRSAAPVSVINPDLGSPPADMSWPASPEIYRASLLLSYGYLAMSVVGDGGRELPLEMIETWVTPIRKPPLELQPGESLGLTVPIGRFFRLESGRAYEVGVQFGEAGRRVEARTRVELR
jgi:hypothetical protein